MPHKCNRPLIRERKECETNKTTGGEGSRAQEEPLGKPIGGDNM